MNKKQVLTAAFIAVLLLSTMGGFQFSSVEGARRPPTVIIETPQNMTYTTNTIPVYILANCPNSGVKKITFNLDQGGDVTVYTHFPERINEYAIHLHHNANGTAVLSGLSDGPHRLEATTWEWFTDLVVSSVVYFTIDTTLPSIHILSPENKIYDTTDIQLYFTVSEPVSWMGYRLDGQAKVTITGNTTLSGLSDGSHSLKVYARDTAGNTENSEIIYFSIRTQPSELFPTLIIVAIVIVVVVGAAFLVYFAKIKKTAGKVE